MNSNRKAAILTGVFFIVGTIAGMISLGVFTDPILGASDVLVSVSANEGKVIVGVLLELVMAVALAGMAIAVYPVLKKRSPSIAIGYFGARILEVGIFILSAISLLTLVTVSKAFVGAGAPAASYFTTLGDMLLAIREWGGHAVLDVAVFPLGALLLNGLLYRARLVPRWVSGWGFVGAALYWAAGLLVLFGVITPLETFHIVLQAPLGVQEIALALWLIVRGFNPSAVAAG
ncbi:MAG: DUF4386 domain-containing protein [Candidatus Atribacteria bacterium]|nr:MAG: DUF4386 domain-containing protein [Candidatus Atribacteria bacterium]